MWKEKKTTTSHKPSAHQECRLIRFKSCPLEWQAANPANQSTPEARMERVRVALTRGQRYIVSLNIQLICIQTSDESSWRCIWAENQLKDLRCGNDQRD